MPYGSPPSTVIIDDLTVERVVPTDASYNLVNNKVSYSLNVEFGGTITVYAFLYEPTFNVFRYLPIYSNGQPLNITSFTEFVVDFENKEVYLDDELITIQTSEGIEINLENITSINVNVV